MSSLETDIKSYFSNKEEVLAVYLYGSQVTGRTTPESDVDIALVLDPKRKLDVFDLRLNYGCDLEKQIHKNCDIVVLNRTDLFLAYQVFSKGVPLFVRDRKQVEIYKWYLIKQYWDFLPLKHMLEDAALKRLQHGY